jgi:hypothetical protein
MKLLSSLFVAMLVIGTFATPAEAMVMSGSASVKRRTGVQARTQVQMQALPRISKRALELKVRSKWKPKGGNATVQGI